MSVSLRSQQAVRPRTGPRGRLARAGVTCILLALAWAPAPGVPLPRAAAGPGASSAPAGPPVFVSSEILQPKGAPYKAYDKLRIETRWEGTVDSIKVDYRNIIKAPDYRDSVARIEPGVFRIFADLPVRTEFQPDGKDKRIFISAFDTTSTPGEIFSAVDSSLAIDVDNTAPISDSLRVDPVPGVTARDSLHISGKAPDSTVVYVQRLPYKLLHTEPDPGTLLFRQAMPLVLGENTIQVWAQDPAGNQTLRKNTTPKSIHRTNEIDSLAVLASYSFHDAAGDTVEAVFRNGDTVRLWTRWAARGDGVSVDSLTVRADFSALDSEGSGQTIVQPGPPGSGIFEIYHLISDSNQVSDGRDIHVPLTAQYLDRFENSDTVRVCLTNHPPQWISSRVLNPKVLPYKTGDSLKIETIWRSSIGLDPAVLADFSEIDTTHAPYAVSHSAQGEDSVFVIRYRLPLNSAMVLPDGTDKAIGITVRDKGCGSSADRSIRISVDATPPPADSLSLDPLPAATRADSVLVSGRAPYAYQVVILRDLHAEVLTAPDSASGRFAAKLALLLGPNKIQIKAEDRAGNATVIYPVKALVVTRLLEGELVVPTPYSRYQPVGATDRDIILRDPGGIVQGTIRIYSLEGDCVRSQEVGGRTVLEAAYHWDGLDHLGRRAPQGYYLVRAEWRDASGQPQQKTTGLLLKD